MSSPYFGLSEYELRHLPSHLGRAACWEALECLLTDLDFLETKTEAGMVFGLVEDFTEAGRMPEEGHHRRWLELLGEAIRREAHFLTEHPKALFQSMWNLCWWYDAPDAVVYYEPATDAASASTSQPEWTPGLFTLLQRWREQKQKPGFRWLRSLRPPLTALGQGQFTILKGHRSQITQVAFTPSGEKFISVSGESAYNKPGNRPEREDRTLRVWNASTGELLFELSSHPSRVTSVACDPAGGRFATGCFDGVVRTWELSSGQPLLSLPDGHGTVREGPRIRVAGRDIRSIDRDNGEVHALVWSPNGGTLVSGGHDGWLQFWNPLTGERGRRLNCTAPGMLSSVVYCLRFSPGGEYLAGGTFYGVRIWNASTWEELEWLDAKEDVFSVDFSPDGSRLAWIGQKGIARVLELPTLREVVRLRGHSTGEYGAAIAFGPDSRTVVTGASDGEIRVWDGTTGVCRGSWRGDGRPIRSIAFAAPTHLIGYGQAKGGVGILSLGSIGRTRLLRSHEKAIGGLVPCPGTGLVASFSEDTKSILWDLETGKVRHTLTGHREPITSARFDAKTGQLATASDDETVRLWDVQTGKAVRTFQTSARIGLGSLALSPDGLTVAACGNVYVWLWDRATGELLHTLKPRPGSDGGMRDQGESVHDVHFSPDGQFLFAFHSGHVIEAWNVQHGLPPDEMDTADPLVRELAARYRPESRRRRFPDELWDLVQASSRSAAGEGGQTAECGSWFLDRRDGEMQLVSIPDNTTVAWLPMELRHRLSLQSSGGLRWVGGVGNHLCLFTLEGSSRAPSPLAPQATDRPVSPAPT